MRAWLKLYSYLVNVKHGDDVIEAGVEVIQEVNHLYGRAHAGEVRELNDVREVDGGGGVDLWVDRLSHLQLVRNYTASNNEPTAPNTRS